MAFAANPFVVLSYVGGPALLTNASSLLVLSTSNRLARAIDRSRFLTAALAEGRSDSWLSLYAAEAGEVSVRLVLIGRAMMGFYLAAAAFGFATFTSIMGAALDRIAPESAFIFVVAAAAVAGLVGFAALVTGTFSLAIESRLAIRSMTRESQMALQMAKAVTRDAPPAKASVPNARDVDA